MDWWKKKKKKRALLCRERGAMLLEDLIKCCDGKSNPIKFFSADLILKATDNFTNSNQFSAFRFSSWQWYSGIHDNSSMILIKKYTNYYHKLGFCRDIAISSMVSGHKNFMKLMGCCLELEYPIMVYFGEKKQYSLIDLEKIVSWKQRMKIAEDIATALAYLHTAFTTPFVYRLMCLQNILIDEDGVAKLIDLSCCISIPQGETYIKDILIGIRGYIDPDYQMNNIISEKTDVYGFGMFMLMLLIRGGERFNEFIKEYYGDFDFYTYDSEWVSKFIQEGSLVNEIVDPKMLDNMYETTEEDHCRMNAFFLLSLRCIGPKGEVPTMVEVAKELKKIQRFSQIATASVSSSSC